MELSSGTIIKWFAVDKLGDGGKASTAAGNYSPFIPSTAPRPGEPRSARGSALRALELRVRQSE